MSDDNEQSQPVGAPNAGLVEEARVVRILAPEAKQLPPVGATEANLVRRPESFERLVRM